MRIAIPDLGIDAPVVEVGWREVEVQGRLQLQWEVASFAAGHHSDSAMPGQAGNVVISGHHNIEGQVFKNISLSWSDNQAELLEDGVTMRSRALDGRSVYLYGAAGEQFEYVFDGMYKMPDRYVSEAQRQRNARFIAPTTEPTLTLITCWPYSSNTHRIVAVARLAD
jgi:sortase A